MGQVMHDSILSWGECAVVAGLQIRPQRKRGGGMELWSEIDD